MKVAALQMNTQDDKAANIRQAVNLIDAAVASEHADLVVLPETFTYMGGSLESQRAHAETFPGGAAYQAMQAQARKHQVFVHAGSMAEADGEKCYNTTLVFDRDGKEIARYRKIHLFDVEVPGGVEYRESDVMKSGREVISYEIDGVTVGCSICYDLRFAELFRRLQGQGAQVIVLPAAFTLQTGRDHWEVLLRARAIETQTYVVASAQVFAHDDGRKVCYGHSMIVDPWGTKIADCSDAVTFCTATIDLDYLNRVRTGMPVAQHRVLP